MWCSPDWRQRQLPTVAPVIGLTSVKPVPMFVTWAFSSILTCRCWTVSHWFTALRQLRNIRRPVPALVFTSRSIRVRVALVRDACKWQWQWLRWQWHTGWSVSLFYLQTSVGPYSAATRLFFWLRGSDCIADALVSLHWLRVPKRLRTNIAFLTHQVLRGVASLYVRTCSRRRLSVSTKTPVRCHWSFLLWTFSFWLFFIAVVACV